MKADMALVIIAFAITAVLAYISIRYMEVHDACERVNNPEWCRERYWKEK